MHKLLKPSRGWFSLALLTLSLGALFLGIGLVSWALVNIGAESVASEVYVDLPPDSTTVMANPVGSTWDQIATFPAPAVLDRGSSSTSTSPAVSQVKPPVDQADPLLAALTRSSSSSSTSPVVSQVKPPVDRVAVAPSPRTDGTMGSLSIPALKQKWPIVQGTGDSELKKGVGHFIGSAMPGEDDNCVLSGHRTTVFRKLGQLKIGDRLIVQTSAGTFTYQIVRFRIVHKDDLTVIVHTDHAVLTLTTCYPFVYVGSAPDRYIVSADLVSRQ